MELNYSAALEDLMRLKDETTVEENEAQQFRATVNQYRRSQGAPEGPKGLELNAAPAIDLPDKVRVDVAGTSPAAPISNDAFQSESDWLQLSCDKLNPSEETLVGGGGFILSAAAMLYEQRLGEHSSQCELKELVQACNDDHNDWTFANAVMDEVHQTKTEHVKDSSSESRCRRGSPWTQEHSSDRLSSCPTDTSTSESGSLWLAEFTEDDDKKLDENHPFIPFRDLALSRVFEAFSSWKGRHSEQDVPCDGAGEPNSASNQDDGKGEHTKMGKRTWAEQSQTSKDVAYSSGSSPTLADCIKRRRTSDRKLTFACPYTKKDPMSYRDCYKYTLSRIRDVKQHLARCHRNPPYCSRCMVTFETEEERDGHVREASCELRPLIKFDGITEKQRRQLAKRSASNTSPEAQWFAVFDIVFPGRDPRPQSPYIDSELLQDITLYQDFLTSHGPRILSGVLAQRGVISWNLPNEERDLAAFQHTVFEEGLGIIFNQWLGRQSSSIQDPNVSSSSGSTVQHTPPSFSNSREMVSSTSAHDSEMVPPESREGLGLVDALLDSEDVPRNLTDQTSLALGGGLDASSSTEQGDNNFSTVSPYDFDELFRQMGDYNPAISEFQPGLGY